MRHLITVISLLFVLGAEAHADGVPICLDGEIPWFTAMPELVPDQVIDNQLRAADETESPFRCRGDLLRGDARCRPKIPAGSVPNRAPLFGCSDPFVTADRDSPPLSPAIRLAFLRESACATHPGYARGLERPPRSN